MKAPTPPVLYAVIFLVIYLLFVVGGIRKRKSAGKAPAPGKNATGHFPQSSLKESLPGKESSSVEGPAEHVRVTVGITPHDHSDMFRGSLGADRQEYARQDMPSSVSEHFFDENWSEDESDPSRETACSLLPSFEGDDLKRAFVMQEVLKRPCER